MFCTRRNSKMDNIQNWDWEDILHLESAAFSAGLIAGESYNKEDSSSHDSNRHIRNLIFIY